MFAGHWFGRIVDSDTQDCDQVSLVTIAQAGECRDDPREAELTLVIEHTDEDEWGLQAQLVGSLARIIKRRIGELALSPIQERPRDPKAAAALAHKAHTILHCGTSRKLMAAISTFRRAIDNDSTCALAHAGLAEALVFKFLYFDGDRTFIDESKVCARRALTIDPQCAEAHTSLGFAHHMTGHNEDAIREYRLAIQLDNDEFMAHRLLGALLAREGNYKAASPLLRRAIVLGPTHIGSYDHLYCVLRHLDRYEEALEVAERTGELAARLRALNLLAEFALREDGPSAHELAADHLANAVVLIEQLTDRASQTLCLSTRARLRVQGSDLAGAFEDARLAAAAAQEGDSKRQLSAPSSAAQATARATTRQALRRSSQRSAAMATRTHTAGVTSAPCRA